MSSRCIRTRSWLAYLLALVLALVLAAQLWLSAVALASSEEPPEAVEAIGPLPSRGTTTSTFFVGTEQEPGLTGQTAAEPAAGNTRPGVIKDWNGEPLANVGVFFSHVDEFPIYSTVFWTDDQGRFTLDLDRLRKGEGQYIVHIIEDADGRRINTHLPVRATGRQAEYVLQLPPPNVALYIQDERGVPVPNADVAIFAVRADSPLHNAGVGTVTDDGGRAVVHLPPDEYYVSVNTMEYIKPDKPRFVAPADGIREVIVTLQLPNVQGTVTVGGQPGRWALLKLIGPDGRVHEIRAFQNGRFIGRLEPGRYYLVQVDSFFRQYGIPHYFGKRYPVTVAGVDAPLVMDIVLPAVNVQDDVVVDGQPVAEGVLLAKPVGADWTLRTSSRMAAGRCTSPRASIRSRASRSATASMTAAR